MSLCDLEDVCLTNPRIHKLITYLYLNRSEEQFPAPNLWAMCSP